MKRNVLLVVGASVALLALPAATASAKWIFGNGPTDLELTTPSPGHVCTDRIQGRAGLNTSVDPSTTPPPPPPYPPVTVRVFHGPPASLDGATVEGTGLRTAEGDLLTADVTKVTAAPLPIKPADEYTTPSGDTLWEYAAAPLNVTVPAGAIPAGDEVAIVRSPRSAFITATAVTCAPLRHWRGVRWNTAAAGAAMVNQTTSHLTFSIGNGGLADPVATYWSACTFTGDFDVRVKYALGPWPAHNGTRLGLIVNNPGYPAAPDGVTTERTSFGLGDVDTGERYVANGAATGGPFAVRSTAALTGWLRILHKGGQLRSFYKDATTGGTFVKIASAPDYSGAVTLGLQAWSGLGVFSGPVGASFSSFTVRTGSCV